MSRRLGRYLWTCVLFLAAANLGGGLATAQAPDPRLEKVFADWRQRRERIASVRYSVRGKHVIPKGSLTALVGGKSDVPPQDVTCNIQRTLSLDFGKGRHRLEVNDQEYDQQTGKFSASVWTMMFDGVVLKGITPRAVPAGDGGSSRGSAADVRVYTGDLQPAAFEAIHWPLFVGHGIVVANRDELIPGKWLNVRPDINLFVVHGQGVHAGRSCLVLRTQPRGQSTAFEEFWVDTARNSAIVRQVQYSRGRAFTDMDCSYEQTPHGWLVAGWTFTLRDVNDGKTVFTERIRVEERAVNPVLTDADFQAEESPGLLVRETKLGA